VKRAAPVVGAVVCLALAAVLLLLAADIMRWRSALRADDVSYRATPGGDLWKPTALLPFGVTRSVLGINDDLQFRQALRALRLAKLEDASNSDPKLILARADAQARLEAIATSGGDPARLSRALDLLAVLQLATPSANPQERASVLKTAVANLQRAIALDPADDNAKYNLEAALRRSSGVQQVQGGPTPNPTSGQNTAKGAATGPPSSGY
jgi:hypothetical protein